MLSAAPIISFVPTKNPARARSFYESALGLRLVSEDPFALVFDANGTSLRVVQVAQFEPYPFTILGWRVPRLKHTLAQLNERGILCERFEGMEQDASGVWKSPSGAKVVWFKDPDGNLLSVSEHPK
jgi:catechol 2,3-dioxygenase-like lactoylglutathione lyase family enzyme